MAEVVGTIASTITLASVLKACLHAFDLFQTAQNADQSLKILLVRLNIERFRLYTWGEAMGLTKDPGPGKTCLLETATCKELVKDTLEVIEQLFQDSEKVQMRYGCKEVKQYLTRRKPVDLDDSGPTDDLAVSFSHFHVPEASNTTSKPQRTKVFTKVRWAIHDQKKFDGLIREVKDLVDGLLNITDPIFATSRQGGMLRFAIQQIQDLDHLEAISAACENDYPDISDAAAVKIDIMTVGTFQRQHIQEWLDGTEDAENEAVPHTTPKSDTARFPWELLICCVSIYLLQTVHAWIEHELRTIFARTEAFATVVSFTAFFVVIVAILAETSPTTSSFPAMPSGDVTKPKSERGIER